MATINIANSKGCVTINIANSKGCVTIDTEVLEEVLTRWVAVCNLAARLCNEMEDAPEVFAERFNREELLHHAISDYTTELQNELRELVRDLEAHLPVPTYTEQQLREEALGLLSDFGENPEYDRAIHEMFARLTGKALKH